MVTKDVIAKDCIERIYTKESNVDIFTAVSLSEDEDEPGESRGDSSAGGNLMQRSKRDERKKDEKIHIHLMLRLR